MKRPFSAAPAILATAVFLLFHISSSAQRFSSEQLARLDTLEKQMVASSDSMYNTIIPETRTLFAQHLAKLLISALRIPGSYNYPFTTLAKHISIISPEDNSFRIFNWGILNTPNTQRYYGAIQMRSEELKLYGLIDYSGQMKEQEEEQIGGADHWFGALYYNILTRETETGKIYVLLGVNRGKILATRKVMDILRFGDKGPEFGAPVITARDVNGTMGVHNRFFLEYKKEAQASMNWDPERNVIVFDKLTSQVNDPARKYTYVPSGQYDGFRWADGQWRYVDDLIPIEIRKDGDPVSEEQPRKR